MKQTIDDYTYDTDTAIELCTHMIYAPSIGPEGHFTDRLYITQDYKFFVHTALYDGDKGSGESITPLTLHKAEAFLYRKTEKGDKPKGVVKLLCDALFAMNSSLQMRQQTLVYEERGIHD